MKMQFTAATIAASLAIGLGYVIVAYSKTPPPPPPPYNPQIAYAIGSQGGHTTTFYVSNADGKDVVSLYSTRNITSGMKLAPTGNRLVFTEGNGIKVLTYAVSSQGVTTSSVTTLTTEQYQTLNVDVSPDGTELLFTEKTATPGQYAVYVMSMSGGPSTQIVLEPDTYYDAIWAHSNSRIAVIRGGPYDAASGKTETIEVVDLDVLSGYAVINLTTVFTNTINQLYQVNRIESAHTSNTLLFDAFASSQGVYTVNIGTMAVSPAPVVAGSNASFSADDSSILFVADGTQPTLFTLNLNTNVQTQINSYVTRPDFLP
jgi:Tol biopolymer transport system component